MVGFEFIERVLKGSNILSIQKIEYASAKLTAD